MPKRNQIEMQGLIDRIYTMFEDKKMTHAQIAAALQKEGYTVSRSGVGRALVTKRAQVKAYKTAVAETAELLKEIKNTPGLDIAEATLQMTTVKLFNEIKQYETFSELELGDKLKLAVSVSGAQSKVAMVKMAYAEGFRKGLFRAGEIVKTELRNAEVSAETIAKFDALLGIELEKHNE
jgi:hypothetical protein